VQLEILLVRVDEEQVGLERGAQEVAVRPQLVQKLLAAPRRRRWIRRRRRRRRVASAREQVDGRSALVVVEVQLTRKRTVSERDGDDEP
jgi:hypothetical protein